MQIAITEKTVEGNHNAYPGASGICSHSRPSDGVQEYQVSSFDFVIEIPDNWIPTKNPYAFCADQYGRLIFVSKSADNRVNFIFSDGKRAKKPSEMFPLGENEKAVERGHEFAATKQGISVEISAGVAEWQTLRT